MSNYFFLTWKHKLELSSAFPLTETKPDSELIFELEGKGSLPFGLELKKITETKDGLITSSDLTGLKEVWLDYQPNSLAWPLMSDKMKTVINNSLTGKEGINWIAANIRTKEDEKIYYIPRFEKKLDVLDMQKTMFAAGTDHIIKPCFSLQKISNYRLFPKPLSHNFWKITSALYIDDILKKVIQKEKLTGIDFEKTAVA